MTLSTEVCLCGGGPAGAATALALARAGIGVVLAGGDEGRGDTVGESLPPSVNPLLERLGVREAFLALEPLPCYANHSVWGSDRLDAHDFIGDPHGCGWHIDRRRFDAMLLDSAERAGARVLRGMRLRQILPDAEGCRHLLLTGTKSRNEVGARAVVDATGRSAALARRLGARRRRADRLAAAAAFLITAGERPSDASTLVEALEDGWWYSAVLPDGRLVVALMTDADLLRDRGAASPEGWRSALAETTHTRGRVADHGYRLADAPRVVAAGSGLLTPRAGDGWLAVGDAAMTFDPLSSHGIGAALEGGLRAAAALRAWLAGDRGALDAYASQTRRAYARYQQLWLAYYAEERRWPDAPFWRRRHEAARSAGLIAIV